MATVKIEAALGEHGNISDFVGTTPLNVVLATGTQLRLVDAQGDGFVFTGTGLTYDQTGLTGGKFTGLQIFSGTGAVLETVANFSVSAKAMYTTYQFGGIGAAVLQLFVGDDVLTGSSIGDNLFGFAGNDTIKGGGGADVIGGSVGRDKLYGQGGADVFLFVAGDGRDTIKDFTDTGGNNDDRIGLTQKLYNAMTITETDTGVTLGFGAKGSIVVDHWHAVDVGLSDFLIA